MQLIRNAEQVLTAAMLMNQLLNHLGIQNVPHRDPRPLLGAGLPPSPRGTRVPFRINTNESGGELHTLEHHRRAMEVEVDELGPKDSYGPASPRTRGRWGGPSRDVVTLQIWKGPTNLGATSLTLPKVAGPGWRATCSDRPGKLPQWYNNPRNAERLPKLLHWQM